VVVRVTRGTYVRLANGLVGVFQWAYENPVHQPGYADRANVSIGTEMWSVNLADLRPVVLDVQNAG
jgi:hypothetical protein